MKTSNFYVGCHLVNFSRVAYASRWLIVRSNGRSTWVIRLPTYRTPPRRHRRPQQHRLEMEVQPRVDLYAGVKCLMSKEGSTYMRIDLYIIIKTICNVHKVNG